ncbi:helix-turn-helix domain-containing protein [Glaciibacter superstes]|uniref:helix-turn-helix domain-containing protein n=1 Tax=Glaciibacter superstes TaxID=501023 RepID=UPI00047A3692|nr:helix-turn-helix transcriptional regulator [Glaciibacter superstes]
MSTSTRTAVIGRRILKLRKNLGITTAAALADSIPNPTITESVIQNIEGGRKSEISLPQVLDIAMALGVPPITLMTDVFHPNRLVDTEGVGSDVAALTNEEFILWFQGDPGIRAAFDASSSTDAENGLGPAGTRSPFRTVVRFIPYLAEIQRRLDAYLRRLPRDLETARTAKDLTLETGIRERLEMLESEAEHLRWLLKEGGVNFETADSDSDSDSEDPTS